MSQRYFTLEEAQALLSEVEETVKSIQDMKRRLDGKLMDWQQSQDVPDEEAENPVESALEEGKIHFMIGQINDKLQSLSDMGCLPKDLEKGLVDFPARINGVEGYLCWQLGEKEIRYWHGITEGFQGRKPIKPPLKTTR